MYYDDSPGTTIRINSIGIFRSSKAVQKHSPKITPQLARGRFHCSLSRLSGSVWEHFSSQATFENVSSLSICYVGVRCIGMILTYLEGHQRVLGQWHEDQSSEHVRIHTLEPVYRQGLRFFLSNEPGYSYLERVDLRPHALGGHSICTPKGTVVDINYAVSSLCLASNILLTKQCGTILAGCFPLCLISSYPRRIRNLPHGSN